MGAPERQWPAFVHAEIENWITSVWDGASPIPHEKSGCGSAERAYRVAGSNSEESDDDVLPPRVFNRERAERVDKIFLSMPLLARQVLRYEFTQRKGYDQYERSIELDAFGSVRPVWIRVANNRREVARRQLGITGSEYRALVDAFKQRVCWEFG